MKLSTTDGNKIKLLIMFTYIFISLAVDSLAGPDVNVLANIESTQISPLWLFWAILHKNRIQLKNNQV